MATLVVIEGALVILVVFLLLAFLYLRQYSSSTSASASASASASPSPALATAKPRKVIKVPAYSTQRASVSVFLGRTSSLSTSAPPAAVASEVLKAVHYQDAQKEGWPAEREVRVLDSLHSKQEVLSHMAAVAAATTGKCAFVLHGCGFYARSTLYFLPSGALSASVHEDLVSLQEMIDAVEGAGAAKELHIFLVCSGYIETHSALSAQIPPPPASPSESSKERAKGKGRRAKEQACRVYVRAVGRKVMSRCESSGEQLDAGPLAQYPDLALRAFAAYPEGRGLWASDSSHIHVGAGDYLLAEGAGAPIMWKWPYAEHNKIQFGESFHFAVLSLLDPACPGRIDPLTLHPDQRKFFTAVARASPFAPSFQKEQEQQEEQEEEESTTQPASQPTSRACSDLLASLRADLAGFLYFSHNQGTKALYEHRKQVLEALSGVSKGSTVAVLMEGLMGKGIARGLAAMMSSSESPLPSTSSHTSSPSPPSPTPSRSDGAQFVVVRFKASEAMHLNTPERMLNNRLSRALAARKLTIFLGEAGALNHVASTRTQELLARLREQGLALDMTGLTRATLAERFAPFPELAKWTEHLLPLDLFRLQYGAWMALCVQFCVREAHGIWSGGLDALALLGIRVYRYTSDPKVGKVRRIEMWHDALGMGKPILCSAELRRE